MAKGIKTGGRVKGSVNKVTATLRELAQPHTEEALNLLLALMRDDSINPDTRLRAAMQILDRGHGKPRQELEVKQDVTNPFPPREVLDAIYEKAMAESKAREERMREERKKLGIDPKEILALYQGNIQE
jgi:hypothetical protein